MPDMGCRLAQPVLAIAYVLSCQPPTDAQVLLPAANPEAQNVNACTPSPVDKRPSGPEIAIAELSFEGDLHLAIADQDQIATSLKERTYSGEPDGVASEVEERVRRAWQDHGYFKVEAHGDASVLTSSPASERIAVTVQLDEGQQYRLENIRFKGNREISNVNALRSLFPIKDGDIFSREEVAKGLDNLRFAYRQMGHINFTSIPNTQFNDERQTISLGIDVDEGKKFIVSNVSILGLDDHVLEDSLLKPGKVYDQRLVDLFWQEHASSLPTDASPDSRIHLQLDERAGTVAITFDLRTCALQERP
jgi:outer membrane protein assembly factor BamA